jgi:hypothetical protein
MEPSSIYFEIINDGRRYRLMQINSPLVANNYFLPKGLSAKGDVMTRYIVKFFNNGHEAEICQGDCEVDAPNSLEAVERGKRVFCAHHGQLTHWSLHADRVSVAETEYPS